LFQGLEPPNQNTPSLHIPAPRREFQDHVAAAIAAAAAAAEVWDVASYQVTLPETNMTGWKPTMNEDVFPIENGDIPVSHVNFLRDTIYVLDRLIQVSLHPVGDSANCRATGQLKQLAG